jgi:hypothetical protein
MPKSYRSGASLRTVACAAVGTALVVLSMPVGTIELAVTSVGLSEILPAAAPPLGLTARLVVAGFAGVMATGVALAIGRQGATAKGEETMGFALSKLTAIGRKRKRAADPLGEMPVIRKADAHPDATVRRPIFANTDFGGTGMFADVPAPAELDDAIETIDAAEAEAAGLAMPRTPEPLDDESLAMTVPTPSAAAPEVEAITGFAPLAAPVPPPGVEEDDPLPAPRIAQPAPTPMPASLGGLSIAELAERFERGLARKAGVMARPIETVAAPVQPTPEPTRAEPRVIADIPPAAAVAVKADVDAEVDEALRAALGTLQRMSAR